jgi:hypothetical protein
MTLIQRPRYDELETLRDIERDAGRAFAAIGMPEIASDEPLPIVPFEALPRQQTLSTSGRIDRSHWRRQALLAMRALQAARQDFVGAGDAEVAKAGRKAQRT